MLGGRLHIAPVENLKPLRILDVGTGTGLWALDMADQYPESEITGVDLSPIQPGWVPSNVQFLVDDVEQEWIFEPESFDYIHLRNLLPGIRNWPRLFQQCYR
jgi:ubiquinone/menaquinone biosynthesis C-methylase UbiE